MSATNLHIAWSRLLMRGLVSSGVKSIVISPGSRSTPLVVAASEEPGLVCTTIIDERSAAFFALGQARATGKPTALLCTSGTAGAHYLPAIIEAGESFLPLIAITADRPWEAYDVASPQTIDQVKLFGDHVRAFFDIGLPDVAALRSVPRIAAQAVSRALEPTPGPVHINAHFRKPLEPVAVEGREPWQDTFDRLMSQGAPTFHAAKRAIDREAVEQLAKACVSAKRGIITCGPSFGGADNLRLAAGALSIATGFPLFAEATSGARFGPTADGVALCGGFDALLRSSWAQSPDLIIELGSTPVSSAYGAFIERNASVMRWVVSPHGWHDPFNAAAHVVQANPDAFAFDVATWVTAADDSRSHEWARRWTDAEAVVWSEVERDWAEAALTEAAIPRLLTHSLPENAWLCVGNSGSVRDLDTFAPPRGRALRVLHQRGASGIDGLISGAAGVRNSVKEPVVLFLGDVSFLHDLGGLAIARNARAPLVIVVVQNDGGRIFEQLPIGKASATLVSEHFVTPHGLSFEHAAQMFGVAYQRSSTAAELERGLAKAVSHPGCTVIEAVVPPTDGTKRRTQLWKRIAERLEGGGL